MGRRPTIRFSRSLAIVDLKRRLESAAYPRLQMGFIVALTGLMGLLSSFLLLRAGMDLMAVRYPIAVVVAYLFFLFLLWLWLRTRASDYLDYFDPTESLQDALPSDGGSTDVDSFNPGGGSFGGGGATGSYGEAEPDADPDTDLSPAELLGPAADADELVLPIFAVVLAVGLAVASLYVVYLAPTLFAEIIVDFVLSYTLYRRLKAAEGSHWISTALRRTFVPFAATAIFVGVLGAAMHVYAPQARSIGEIWNRDEASMPGESGS